MNRRAIITDLDGTLLQGNSMHIFMRSLPVILRKKGKYFGALESLWWMALRSLRLISHKTMKWHLAAIARQNLSASDWTDLAEKIAETINPAVKKIIDSRLKQQSPSQVIIATAAMEDYVRPLCLGLGYDAIIATKFTPRKRDYVEMRGVTKLKAIKEILEKDNLLLDTFLTDHYDDCPTAEAFPGETIIVNPSEQHEALFRKIGVTRFYRGSLRDGSCRL